MPEKYGVKLSKLSDVMGFEPVYKAAGYDGVEIYTEKINRPGLELAGFFDYFDGDRIQLIGKSETSFLKRYNSTERRNMYDRLFERGVPALIVCHGAEPAAECIEMAQKYNVTVLKTKRSTSEVFASLLAALQEELAPRITRHGVFVEVYGEGMLLIGESGVGKSEAAIELIKRGHRLIADDAVEIRRLDANTLIGMAPELIRYYIELRGIGVVDVRRIFGSGAVKLKEQIEMVVNLVPWKEGASYDRLGLEDEYTEILGVKVPVLTIPINPGRNIAVILEVAAMNNRQKVLGHNSALELASRIDAHIDGN